MGLLQFSLSMVMAVLGCGGTHFICLDTFNYFSSFRNLRVKCFQQCPRIFDTLSVWIKLSKPQSYQVLKSLGLPIYAIVLSLEFLDLKLLSFFSI